MAITVIEPVYDPLAPGFAAAATSSAASTALIATANTADTAFTSVGELASVAAALVSMAIAQQYIDLADDYYDRYAEQRQFYYDYFQQQGEAPFASEQFSTPFYTPDYVGLAGGGIFPPGVLLLFNPQVSLRAANTALSWSRKARMYNAVLDTSSATMDFAAIADDWYSYMFRYEEHKRDVFNARRWTSQMDSLSYGVKEAASVERGLATSFQVFDEASGQLQSEINSVSNGLATYQARKDTIEAMYGSDNPRGAYLTSNWNF